MQYQSYMVMGMARSGVAAAEFLARQGARVLINDRKSREEIGSAAQELTLPNVDFRLGEDPVLVLADAQALVLSPGIPDTHPVVQAARSQGKEVLSEIELAYRCFPGITAAITGTNGKTTTTTLLTQILKNAGKNATAVGNIGIPFTGICATARPEDVAVCEVSSFQMETCSTFRPRVAAVLNITPDHLNRHGTMDVYIGLKEKLFSQMAEKDVVVLNHDDPITRAMASRVPCCTHFFSKTVPVASGAFVQEGWIVCADNGALQRICPADEVKIAGEHNLENALAATAMAYALHVPAPVIRHTLRTFPGVEHRIETVCTFRGVTFINDSKGTNADSTIRAVRTMDRPTVLIAGGSEKNQDFAPLCSEIAASQVRRVVLIGVTASQMERQLLEAGITDVYRAGSDFAQAVRLAQSLAGEGWNVLLSPANASFDMFTDYEQRGRIFKEIVHEIAKG